MSSGCFHCNGTHKCDCLLCGKDDGNDVIGVPEAIRFSRSMCRGEALSLLSIDEITRERFWLDCPVRSSCHNEWQSLSIQRGQRKEIAPAMKNVTKAKKVKVKTKSKGSSGAVPMNRGIEYLRNFINNGGTITLGFTGGGDTVHEKTLSWNTVRALQTAMPTLFNGVRTPIDTYNKKQVAA